MTFEERLDRLADRHAALAESVEMLRDRTSETAANLNKLEGHVERLEGHVERLETQIEKYAAASQLNFDRLTTAMLGLTEHIDRHESRIQNLEQR